MKIKSQSNMKDSIKRSTRDNFETGDVYFSSNNQAQDETSSSCCSSLSKGGTAPSSSFSVKFKSVMVREYSVTIGDNPSCTSGCPISIGWEYEDKIIDVPLDCFEEYREGQRRATHQMRLPATVRHNMLREWAVPTKEILKVQKQCDKVKKERITTLRNEQWKDSMKSLFSSRRTRMTKSP